MKQCLEWVAGYPSPEPLSEYPVNVAIPTAKVSEFNVVWQVVTLALDDTDFICLVSFSTVTLLVR